MMQFSLFIEQNKLFQIDSGYYCAGFITQSDTVVYSAPIISWMIGKTIDYVSQYCKNKNFKLTEIN